MKTKFTVGRFSTGCERKVSHRLEKVLEGWTEAFEHCIDSKVHVCHQEQPHFKNITVLMDISLDHTGQATPSSKHFTNSFTLTIEDVRNNGDAALDKMLDTRARVCVLELKTIVDLTCSERKDHAEA